MGLIKSGIKYGTLAYVANKAVNVIGQQQHQQQQQPAPQQPQQYPQQQQRDMSGYQHQSWCNGTCGHHCNDSANFAANNGFTIREAGESDAYYNQAPAGTYGTAAPAYKQ